MSGAGAHDKPPSSRSAATLNPFPGPQPYRAEHRLYFKGREDQAKKLKRRVLAHPCITLFGPSGAGKSSLMQAGVIPELIEEQTFRVVRVDGWPAGESPVPWLVRVLYTGLDLGEAPEDLGSMDRALGALDHAMTLAEQRSDRPILIYLDQLEQVLFPGRDALGARALMEAIDRLARRPAGGLHVVLSLREDYLGRFRERACGRRELLDHGFRLGPLSVAEMTRAVCDAAEEAGAPWDEAYLHRLMLDVRTPGQSESDESEVQAAFGQIVCRALWERQASGQASEMGTEDAEQILRHYLDTTLEALGSRKDAAQRLLEEHLVDKDGNRTLLTESEARGALPAEDATTVLEDLERAAVLRAEAHHGSRYFELGHDWLAKKVFERRQAREQEEAEKRRKAEEAQRRAEEQASRRRLVTITVIAVVVAALMGVMLIWALRSAEAARKAEYTARTAEEGARTASKMAAARELLARGQTPAASRVLLELKDPESVRGWAELVKETLTAGIPECSLRHKGRVNFAAWSPDGRRIVTVSKDKTARVWNADSPGDPLVLKGIESDVDFAAWSPDGKRIVISDGTPRVWNADGSGDSLDLDGYVNRDGAWSPDGNRIVTMSGRFAMVWKADGSGKPLLLGSLDRFDLAGGHQGDVYSAAWSPDGKRIVTASEDKTARVWNANGSGAPLVLEGHERAVTSAAWSPDGKRIVTASEDKTARVWNANGSGAPLVLKGHERAVTSAAWSPNGERILTVSQDETARVWNTDGSGTLLILNGHVGAWSPDGTHIVTASEDWTACVWNADGSGDPIVLKGHEHSLGSAAWSPDGKRIVTASADKTARVWNANGSGDPIVLKGHELDLISAAWSADGKRIVTLSSDTTARVWNADGSGDPIVLKGHYSQLISAAWSPDSKRIVTASWDATARVWNADGSGDPMVLSGHQSEVWSAAWSPDGKRIVTASSEFTARVWNADGSGEPVVLKGHNGSVHSAAWSPDGKRIVTASSDTTARVWNADGSGEPFVLNGHDGEVVSAAWSPDGKHIVTASEDKTARIWLAGIPALQQALRQGTTYCLTPNQRQTYLLESQGDAREKYEACERSYARTPFFSDTTSP